MSRTPVLLSWSGGKDAAWALHTLRARDDVEVVGLVTTITSGYERISMQGIRVDVLHAQARATGLEVIEARIPAAVDNAGRTTTNSSPPIRATVSSLRITECRRRAISTRYRSCWSFMRPSNNQWL